MTPAQSAEKAIRDALAFVDCDAWRVPDSTDPHWRREVRDAEGFGIVWCGRHPIELAHATTAYIAAANPAALTALLDELEMLRRDAGRYGWLRHHINTGPYTIAKSNGFGLNQWCGDDPDRAIDAAMKENRE